MDAAHSGGVLSWKGPGDLCPVVRSLQDMRRAICLSERSLNLDLSHFGASATHVAFLLSEVVQPIMNHLQNHHTCVLPTIHKR